MAKCAADIRDHNHRSSRLDSYFDVLNSTPT
jgi:hypothetical protein